MRINELYDTKCVNLSTLVLWLFFALKNHSTNLIRVAILIFVFMSFQRQHLTFC